MKTFQSIYDFKPKNKTVLTLGTFDGVHFGHKKIIEKLIQNSTLCECESLVLTFFPHPRMVLQDSTEIKLLNTIEERTELLKKSGLDNLIIHPFDQAFSRLTAEEFVYTILVNQFNVKKIIIGYDHRFGRNRTADINDLIEYGEKYNFEVEQISAQEIDEVSVSSTKIRNALIDGQIKLANDYLGYNYLLTGTIVKGKGIGRTLDFPTANLQLHESYKLIPKNGVYIIQSLMKNKLVYGMMNIGFNPTVNGDSKSIEIHFFDFDADLYSKKIQIQFLDRIRDEVKFENVDKLKEQLLKDKTAAIQYINSL
ncbi:bifunctional riboflavin kinase/FAD synthetase [Flavobacterium lacus]|uniref:Riboflavin biosynthesis protein n=1 Tax=Flavobacterium lacus TaxID=1353778 RepID=A0A328WW75_9FLAO|nr:bifunctional riboflavin kinase/FAD synthetase [Flavobacterium lacus]RAR50462.1 riboflavin kinase/FMN adenylyltransferase [Flavobacterium lacus]